MCRRSTRRGNEEGGEWKGGEGKGACRGRGISLPVPMLHARSTNGLTGGSKVRNFPLLAKGDVRVSIDRHKGSQRNRPGKK
jgi:hypothetical protein